MGCWFVQCAHNLGCGDGILMQLSWCWYDVVMTLYIDSMILCTCTMYFREMCSNRLIAPLTFQKVRHNNYHADWHCRSLAVYHDVIIAM